MVTDVEEEKIRTDQPGVTVIAGYCMDMLTPDTAGHPWLRGDEPPEGASFEAVPAFARGPFG